MNQFNSEVEKMTLDSSLALNEITTKLLSDRAKDCRRLWIALIFSLLINVVIVGAFLWYESQWECTTEQICTTVEQDTGEGNGNNVYQAGEYASYSEAPVEEVDPIG